VPGDPATTEKPEAITHPVTHPLSIIHSACHTGKTGQILLEGKSNGYLQDFTAMGKRMPMM
jgi:hypothetical protein